MGYDTERTIGLSPSRRKVDLGCAEAINKHYAKFLVEQKRVRQWRLNFERKRPQLLRECLAELIGVFLYGR